MLMALLREKAKIFAISIGHCCKMGFEFDQCQVDEGWDVHLACPFHPHG